MWGRISGLLLFFGLSIGSHPCFVAAQDMGVADTAIEGTANISTVAQPSRSKWDDIKRNIGTGFFNFSSTRADALNRSRGFLESYSYLSLEYRLGRGEKVFYRPAFLFSSAGENAFGSSSASRFAWSDGFFGYSNYNLHWLPFNMDYKTEIRLYIPTSEMSQTAGTVARLRGDLMAWHIFTPKTSFMLWFKPDFYIQSRTAYRHERGFARGNRNYGYELSANLSHTLTRKVSFGASVGHSQMWTHASDVERMAEYRTESVDVQAFVGLTYKSFLTHLGITQEHDVARPRIPLKLFADTETQYFARSFYRF